jgi:hypothetical protein
MQVNAAGTRPHLRHLRHLVGMRGAVDDAGGAGQRGGGQVRGRSRVVGHAHRGVVVVVLGRHRLQPRKCGGDGEARKTVLRDRVAQKWDIGSLVLFFMLFY